MTATTKARKGDLVLMSTRTRVATWNGQGEIVTRVEAGIVASATRDGAVKKWQPISGMADNTTLMFPTAVRPNQTWQTYPATSVDVTEALNAARQNRYTTHTQAVAPFTSFRAAEKAMNLG